MIKCNKHNNLLPSIPCWLDGWLDEFLSIPLLRPVIITMILFLCTLRLFLFCYMTHPVTDYCD